MNAVYGYPLVGPAALSGLGQAGGAVDKLTLVYNVATGQSAADLRAKKLEQDKLDQRVTDLKRSTDEAPRGAARDAALLAYSKAAESARKGREELATAIANHNEIADVIQKISFGAYNPGRVSLSGMGAGPAGFLIGAAVVAAAAYFIDRMVVALAAWNGQTIETKGYLQQGADALKEAGVTIKEFGGAMTKTAWAVAGLLGAYLAYQIIQDYRRGRRSSAPVSAPAPIKIESAPKMLMAPKNLKTAKGKVIA